MGFEVNFTILFLDNVSSEDFYPLSDESLLHETFQSKESTEFISDTIGSCDLKDEAPGENEKENVKSNANAPKRKRESSTCEQSKAKNARCKLKKIFFFLQYH